MTLPVPELADGALEALLRPLLLLELLDLELLELELLDAPESELPEFAVLPAVLPEDAEAVEAACSAPGSANATAPAASTLATPAVAVTLRSRACP